MEKIIILFITLFCIVITSCKRDETIKLLSDDDKETTQKYDQIKELEWLTGNWEYKSDIGIARQNWKKVNNHAFTGKGYMLRNKDTISSQSILLDQKGDSLYYVTSIKPVNNKKPVSLTLTGFAANKYIFENHTNDYPEKIIYNKVDEDNIVIETSGMLNGRMNVEELKLYRVK